MDMVIKYVIVSRVYNPQRNTLGAKGEIIDEFLIDYLGNLFFDTEDEAIKIIAEKNSVFHPHPFRFYEIKKVYR